MGTYRCKIEIDVDADSPVEAAQEAWRLLTAEGSMGPIVEVNSSLMVDLNEVGCPVNEGLIGRATVASREPFVVYGKNRGMVSAHSDLSDAFAGLKREEEWCAGSGHYSDACVYRWHPTFGWQDVRESDGTTFVWCDGKGWSDGQWVEIGGAE